MKKLLFVPALLIAIAVSSPASTTINLLSAGNSNGAGSAAFSGGNFIVQQISPQSTGTGVIDSFLRIQQTGQERGYNTDVGTPLDDKGGGFTRTLQLSDVPTVTIGGVVYRQFLLDINQNGSQLLSLNQIQIFQSGADPGGSFTLSEATATQEAVISGLGTQIFQMSNPTVAAANAYELQMNFALNSG